MSDQSDKTGMTPDEITAQHDQAIEWVRRMLAGSDDDRDLAPGDRTVLNEILAITLDWHEEARRRRVRMCPPAEGISKRQLACATGRSDRRIAQSLHLLHDAGYVRLRQESGYPLAIVPCGLPGGSS